MQHAKRWQDRDLRWVPEHALFDPGQYSADVLDRERAKSFVVSQHYAGSFSSCRLAVGLWGPGARLVGVIVYAETYDKVIRYWTGLGRDQACELSRLVCDPTVGYNGESWFAARANRFVREIKGIRAVLSYADPVERRDSQGRLVKQAHWGGIYQAMNALYGGRGEARVLLRTPTGTVINNRTLTKLRAEARGWKYCEKQLLAGGAPPRHAHESLREWVDRVSPSFSRFKHPGNLAYVFGLDRPALASIRQRHGGGQTYLKGAA